MDQNVCPVMPVYVPRFKKAGMKAGVLPLPLAFSFLSLLKWRACDLNLVIFNSSYLNLDAHLSAVLLLLKNSILKVGDFFLFTKFESQALHIKRIK